MRIRLQMLKYRRLVSWIWLEFVRYRTPNRTPAHLEATAKSDVKSLAASI
jgi:hypothetical protein